MTLRQKSWQLIKETLREWQEDGASNIAASLAYYAIFSLSPLLILIALMAGILLDREAINNNLFNDIENTVGVEATNTLRDIMENNEQTASLRGGGAGYVIWLSVMVWGASGLFTQLQNALNKIWEVKAMPGRSPLVFFKNRLLSLVLVVFAGIFLIGTMVINTGMNYLVINFSEVAQIAYLIRPLQFVVSVFMLTMMFGMIYKILPDVIIRWKDVWVGAGFTAFLFFIGQFIVGLYLANTNPGSVFGAAGSLTVILVWIYYSAQILLFGAEFTEVWARHHGAYIRPDEDAVWLNEIQAQHEAEAAGINWGDG